MTAGERNLLDRSKPILLDTNVWLDYLQPERPGHAVAFKLIDASLERDVNLLIAATSTKDLFYVLEKSIRKRLVEEAEGTEGVSIPALSKDIAWGLLNTVQEIATTVPVDDSDVWIARKLRCAHDDYEDNLVLAAAMRSKASCLVTSDERLIEHSNVATMKPAQALRLLCG